MKLYKTLILLITSIILTACMPDTFTKWTVQDPSSPGDGAQGPEIPGTTPPDPNISIPPTNIAYSPPSSPEGNTAGSYFYDQTSQTNTGELPEPLVCIALNGGEIREGDMSFFVSQVKTRDGIITGEKALPSGLVLNPLTGEITGFTQVFTDGKYYTIQGNHIGGKSVNTTIQLTISTKPESLYYPQINGLSLILNVDKPENFQVGNTITSNRNAQGIVNYVDIEKKVLHIQVDGCILSVTSCPIFIKDDLLDDTMGFFREEAKITEEVTYAYQNKTIIQAMTPVIIPGVDGERPEFSISPNIQEWGLAFDRNTGEISGVPFPGINLPRTLFNVTVKNINGQTANVNFYLSSLDVISPQAISSISYDYQENYRVVLNVENIRKFQNGKNVTNQDKTSGTVIGIDEIDKENGNEEVPGSMLVLIKNGSNSKFETEQAIDDSDPFSIPLTTIQAEPEIVFLLKTKTDIPVAVEPTLDQDELDSLTWKSEPVLPHLCSSKQNPETVFFKDENADDCTQKHGVCSDSSNADYATCTAPGSGNTWTTDGVFDPTEELYFNRKTGKFGAKNPTKAFTPQKFDITVTTLDGSETKTEVTFGFQSSPQYLSYSNQVILEVDKYDKFDINDYVSTPEEALGIVKGKEDSVDGEKLLIVKVLAGEFEINSDIDNQKIFTYQKSEIKNLKYGQVGLAISTPAIDFEIGEEVSTGSCSGGSATNKFDCENLNFEWIFTVAGIVQYRQTDPINILWIRLISLDQGSDINKTFATDDLLSGSNDDGTSQIIGIFGDILYVQHLGIANFAAGMDVATASPTSGFGMVNSANNDTNSLVLSQASGSFSLGSDLYRMNPSNTENQPAGGQGFSSIQGIGQVQTFYIDRGNQLPIQPVLDSPEDNGVTFSITPPLPLGLTMDEKTGKISITTDSKGPNASNLSYYTVSAKNLLGEATTQFGLKVREIFAIEDITGLDSSVDGNGQVISPNLSSVLHKSGEGYNTFPCRVTSDQVFADDNDAIPTGWATRAKNITCIYDVGEADLFYNGIKFKINTGSDLCQYIEHVPTWFYSYQVQTTDPTVLTPVVRHMGDWDQPQCAVAQQDGVRIEFPNGEPVEQCSGDYSNNGGPNCDEGSVPILERNYTVVNVCVDADSGSTGDSSEEDCFNNNGFCSDSSFSDRESCLNATNAPSWNSTHAFIQSQCFFKTTEDNRTDCENAYGICSGGTSDGTEANRAECDLAGGAWTPTSIWADNATCEDVPGIIGPDAECGGEKVSCIAGPAKDDENFPQKFLTDRYGKDAFGQVISVTSAEEINFTYNSPNSKSYKSNIYLSNYSRLNQCTPYGSGSGAPWTGTDFEYNINQWTDLGKNKDPYTAEADDNPFAGGNGVYDYRCLDGARNVRARIRILIRDWDWNFKPSNQVDVMNLVNPPWVDGDLMDNPTGMLDPQGFPANSFLDWDNLSTGGSCEAPTYNYPESDL